MKIAIHHREGSFSERWIPYCKENNIPFKIVNCYNNNIIDQLKDCDGLMWHWHHTDYRAQNFARQLIFSLQKQGIKVFPDFETCWHFDDKVGQKYLLESIGAPFIPSYVFYTKKEALDWAEKTTFPKVFKLRGGAGSANVKLVKDIKQAKKLIHNAFKKGYPLINQAFRIKENIKKVHKEKSTESLINLIKSLIIYLFWPNKNHTLLPKQKGYVYFQDFVADNEFDDRVVIIGEKAIAIRRTNRKNDFRASGSGIIKHDPEVFSTEIIKIAFDVSKKIGAQSLAFDFIYKKYRQPLIVEISYAYAQGSAYDSCPGYWDSQLKWHPDNVNPQHYIIEDFISSINNQFNM